MSDFQVTIVEANKPAETEEGKPQGFKLNQHGRSGKKVVEKIEELECVWDQVIVKLTDLASKSHVAALTSQYELSQIEFNVGVEAGLSVGLVTKGNASVSVTFSRKSNTGDNESA